MSLETLITIYGYPMIFVGSILEGETTVIIGGFLAHSGYLELPWVVFFSFLGSFMADESFFWFGRTRGIVFLERRPTWQYRVKKVHSLLERYQTLVIIGFRFLYGFRSIIPFAIGTTGISVRRFMILNCIGTALWATTVGSAGYAFGQLLKAVIGKVKQYELTVLIGLAIFGGIILVFRLIKRF